MPEVRIAAEPRTEFGKGPARRMRRAGRVPAVLYGHGTDTRHVTLPGQPAFRCQRAELAGLVAHPGPRGQHVRGQESRVVPVARVGRARVAEPGDQPPAIGHRRPRESDRRPQRSARRLVRGLGGIRHRFRHGLCLLRRWGGAPRRRRSLPAVTPRALPDTPGYLAAAGPAGCTARPSRPTGMRAARRPAQRRPVPRNPTRTARPRARRHRPRRA